MGIVFTRQVGAKADEGFGAAICNVDDIEEARRMITESGGTEEVVGYVDLDEDDLAIAAISGVLWLAIDANLHRKNGAEELLLKLFMAGRASASQ
ncbi:MAG: hypothetical protein WDN10_03515 [bacterium]